MGYAPALEKAWSEIASLTKAQRLTVRLLADEYEINPGEKKILSLSCNVPAKEYTSIIILHFLIKQLQQKSLPLPSGEWVDFKQLEGGDAYYPAFKKRVINTILRKYGHRPEALLEINGRLQVKKAQLGDIGITLEAMERVPVLITFWKADEEFGPEANILFDKSVTKIFCTEDIVVLAELVVRLL